MEHGVLEHQWAADKAPMSRKIPPVSNPAAASPPNVQGLDYSTSIHRYQSWSIYKFLWRWQASNYGIIYKKVWCLTGLSCYKTQINKKCQNMAKAKCLTYHPAIRLAPVGTPCASLVLWSHHRSARDRSDQHLGLNEGQQIETFLKLMLQIVVSRNKNYWTKK